MTIFRKLFATYLLVVLLALVISGGFAGYLVWQAGAQTEGQQLQAYGRELSALLNDQEWTAETLDSFKATATILDSGEAAHIWLLDRTGATRYTSPSAVEEPLENVPAVEWGRVLSGKVTMVRPRPREDGTGLIIAFPVTRRGQVEGAVLLRPAIRAVVKARVTILRFILWGALLSAVLLGAISFYLTQRLARPIEKVSAAVRTVAQGDFSARVQWRSDDEVGRLAAAFNEMAQELDLLESARKELMANVSHELKGPLARISGYLEAVQDGVGGEEARTQHFAIVRREVSRLTRLVNDMLDYSRLEVGRLKLHTFPSDLSPILIRAAQVFVTPAADAGVALTIAIAPMLPIVDAEPERIEQVLVNLLENALAFTPRDGRVTVTAAEVEGALQVEVADTGPGVPPEELERIFDRFYKLDRARTPDRRGFGLGLTIVRQLVELHGGKVYARSAVGEGSVFGFRLPLATPGSPA
jgi:signal transduction histidine kinase